MLHTLLALFELLQWTLHGLSLKAIQKPQVVHVTPWQNSSGAGCRLPGPLWQSLVIYRTTSFKLFLPTSQPTLKFYLLNSVIGLDPGGMLSLSLDLSYNGWWPQFYRPFVRHCKRVGFPLRLCDRSLDEPVFRGLFVHLYELPQAWGVVNFRLFILLLFLAQW